MRNRLKTWDPLRPLLGGWGDVGEASGPRAVPGIPGCVCAGPGHGSITFSRLGTLVLLTARVLFAL